MEHEHYVRMDFWGMFGMDFPQYFINPQYQPIIINLCSHEEARQLTVASAYSPGNPHLRVFHNFRSLRIGSTLHILSPHYNTHSISSGILICGIGSASDSPWI